MRDIDDVIRKIEAREASAAERHKYAKEAERRNSAVDAVFMREAALVAEATGIPVKDRELSARGELSETMAVLVVRGKTSLTADGRLVILSGKPGCGKTTAASAWLLDWVSDRANWLVSDSSVRILGHSMFVSAPALSRWPKYDQAAMLKLITAKRLVIDDIGEEYVDERGAFSSLLGEVMNDRYANLRPTVVTTNLPADKFKPRYGERIADRIREAGRFVSLSNESMRRKPTKETT